MESTMGQGGIGSAISSSHGKYQNARTRQHGPALEMTFIARFAVQAAERKLSDLSPWRAGVRK
jgi:hypothetical protein